MSLKSRLILQCACAFAATMLLLFLPAGTLDYWEAWVFLGIFLVPMVFFSAYYYKYDPSVVERRMQSR